MSDDERLFVEEHGTVRSPEPACRRCHECPHKRPTANIVCHPVDDENDDGQAVLSCKHCERVVPWVDTDDAPSSGGSL